MDDYKSTEKAEPLSCKEEINDILCKDERGRDILLRRVTGKTLEVVGQELGLTRERVRQIEARPRQAIEECITRRYEDFCKSVTTDSLLDNEKGVTVFGKEIWGIIKYIMIASHKHESFPFRYMEQLGFIYVPAGKPLEEVAKMAIKSTKGKPQYDAISEFTKIINYSGYPFWTEELTQKYFKINNINTYNNKLYKGKIKIKNAILYIAEDFFEDGVKTTNPEHLKEFSEKINEVFHLKTKPNRALVARIQDTLILRNKSLYISPSALEFDVGLAKEIEAYINSLPENRITYESLLNIFEDKIVSSTNVDNYYYLHGALKKFVNDGVINLICYSAYVGKASERETSKQFFKPFYDYIKSEHRPVSTEELLKVFSTWPEKYFKYAIMYYPTITIWGQDKFFCLDNLNLDNDDINIIKLTLDKTLDAEQGVTTGSAVYNELQRTHPEILSKIYTDSGLRLYHVLVYLFGNQYNFSNSRIYLN